MLPLAAAALGASVLLAAASRREEKEALAAEIRAAQQQASALKQAADLAERQSSVAAQTVATMNVEAPAVAVSTLAALAGVVKESFDGLWNEAVRISPADAPITIVTHNWVNGVDPVKRLQEIAENDAYIEWYYQNVYVKEVENEKAQEKAQAAAEAQATAEWSRIIASTGGRVLTDLSNEQFIDFVSQSAGAAEAATTYIAAQLAAYEAKQKEASEYSNQVKAFQEGEAASNASYDDYKAYHDKMDSVEALTEDKNIIEQKPVTVSTNPLGPNGFAPVSGAVTGGIINTTEDETTTPPGPNTYAPVTSDISSAATEEMSKFAAEFTLSMIPIIGDGSGIAKELYNLSTTGEMDELNLTLSIIGLAMDSPWDAGFAGDAIVATLKGFTAMIPSGPAREVLLEVFTAAYKNPEAFAKFFETINKLKNSSELVDALVTNPEMFKAVLMAGPEAVEELLKHEDEAIQLVKELDDDGIKALLEGGDDAVKKVFESNQFDELGKLKADIRYQAGEFDYFYETDSIGRLNKFETDDLQLTTRDTRLTHDPNTPGKLDGDHAGHLAGDRFGGSPELDNLVSQAQNVNLSEYKKIENIWAKAIEDGKKVAVQVDIKYLDDGVRPSEFIVKYTIDGKPFKQNILN